MAVKVEVGAGMKVVVDRIRMTDISKQGQCHSLSSDGHGALLEHVLRMCTLDYSNDLLSGD